MASCPRCEIPFKKKGNQKFCDDCITPAKKERKRRNRFSLTAQWNKPENKRATAKSWRDRNIIKSREYHRNYYDTTAKTKKYAKKTTTRLKDLVFSHYGNSCSCCGEAISLFLTLEHCNSDGYLHKGESLRGGSTLWRKIRDEGFPTNYTVLCWNCNCGRPRHQKTCVHKDKSFQNSPLSSSQRHKRKKKFLVLQHYGNKCACCGENEFWFLTIDHVNNDGHVEYSSIYRSGHMLHTKIIREAFPNSYQILCWNCNVGKHLNGGECPHRNKVLPNG